MDLNFHCPSTQIDKQQGIFGCCTVVYENEWRFVGVNLMPNMENRQNVIHKVSHAFLRPRMLISVRTRMFPLVPEQTAWQYGYHHHPAIMRQAVWSVQIQN
jgi:hypothetical protein